ncbi:MAG: pilus assembly protein N-terminal domain-containing protein [Deltaproteobacteria bacterium]|nr:pilus assembly protein N-terminal domain-containing protein [Deltaproteobacteria bacterium]
MARSLVGSASFRLLALLSLTFALSARAQESTTISLGVGQQKVIQVSDVQRVAIGEPDIADVKQVGGGGELLVTGITAGRTSLLIWKTNGSRVGYSIVVRTQDPKEVVSEVRALLGEREGIQIRVVGDRVYLDGETITTDDYDRVQQVATLYPSVKSFVRPSGNAKRLAAESLNRAFAKAGLKGVTATVLGSTIFLEGWVEAKEDLAKADMVVKAVGEKAENLLSIGTKRMVLVEVEFVEVGYDDNKLVGIKPPLHIVSSDGTGVSFNVLHPLPALGDQGTQGVATFGTTLTAATDFSIGARFDYGYSRVLSQPKLVCASGEKAEFLAGGEVPVIIVTANQFAVEYKKYGVVLNITPSADRSGNIGTEVYAEVSDIDNTNAVRANGFEVPGFKVRSVKTNVTVKDGETIALSGLFNYNEDKEVSKVPLLGHIPIIGELFKSRNFIDKKTELAIYVTPHLATPNSKEVKDLIQDARRLYKEAQDSVSFSLFD